MGCELVVPKYHVEYDVEIEGEWGEVERGMRYAEARISVAPTSRLVSTPANAVITEIKEPIKVGDTVDSVEQLEELPYKAIILDSEGDAWQRRNSTSEWYCSMSYHLGEDSGSLLRGGYGTFKVLHLPEES